MGLKRSISAPGLFHSDKLIVNLYVDDLLLVGSYEILHNAMRHMRECFSAKGNLCGESFAYFGLAIHRQRLEK